MLKIAHEESSLFPKFKIHVQSPIEAIYHSVSLSKGSNRVALLASILAYLMNCDDLMRDKDARSHADVILCNILQSMSDIPEWKLSALLCGMLITLYETL